jgi:hypothetical protein
LREKARKKMESQNPLNVNNFMRTIFLLFMFLISVSVFGQESSVSVNTQKPYVSLQECNNDTIKYIETNFIQNKERYIGQPYSKFSKEFELDIYIRRMYKLGRPDDGTNVWGLRIDYVQDTYYSFWIKNKNKKYYVIFLEFERPYTIKPPFRTAIRKNEFRDLFNVYTIKDMEVKCGLVKTKEERENFGLWKGSKF